ncbi:MAG: hypothetical protein C4278_01430 [Patescibacteria group bacterium]
MRYYLIFSLIFILIFLIIFVIFLLPEKEIRIEVGQKFSDKNLLASSFSFLQSQQNFCSPQIEFLEEDDKKFCFKKPKLKEKRGIEVDLTNKKVLLYDEGKLIKILPLLYQAPEGQWFQSPTGYLRVGIKKEKHLSSLFPVIMPYSIQIYEDFFMHGIPYYPDGRRVNSDFTGGCLRFEDEIAKEIYQFAKPGDQVIVYKTFDDLEIKSEFHPPVDYKNYWIRQRFNNPFRKTRKYSGTENLKFDYYQHAGVDLAPNPETENLSVYAIFDGKVVKIQLNDEKDHGLGNTIIIEHQINNEKIYSLYAHLSSIENNIKEGETVKKGEIIGKVGNSGYGCQNYWKVGPDGCDNNLAPDIHLHFELKKAPVLENPFGGKACQRQNGEPNFCYGYTPDYPQKYGYLDPINFLFEKSNRNMSTNLNR